MADKKKQFVVTINGEPHQVIVLLITGRDAQGRISQATIGHADTVFDLEKLSEGGKVAPEFVTALVPAKCLKKGG